MKFKQFKKILSMVLVCSLLISILTTSATANSTTYRVNLTGTTTIYTGPLLFPTGDDRATFNLNGNGTYRIQIINIDTGVTIFDSTRNGVSNFSYTFVRAHDIRVMITRVGATQVTGSWTYTNNRVTRNARIFYDITAARQKDPVFIHADYFQAAMGIDGRFGIFLRPTGMATQNNTLNGATCPNPSWQMCGPASMCGQIFNCDSLHQKGANRLNWLLRDPNIYTVRLVGHVLCYNESVGQHNWIYGLAQGPGKNSISSLHDVSQTSFRFIIQHELSHNVGVTNHCNNFCVMSPGDMPHSIDRWCASHAQAIITRKNNGLI